MFQSLIARTLGGQYTGQGDRLSNISIINNSLIIFSPYFGSFDIDCLYLVCLFTSFGLIWPVMSL